MDLLKQCQQWFEQDEAQKVIDTLEAIPAEERTPELDSELAKAYIAVAHIGEREPFEKALELLAPHEEYFAEDHCWNYRIALAYYCLDEEGPALRYFEKALKARPGDKDTQEYINDCRRRLSLPRFEKNFRERTQEAWAAFSQIEAELRQIIDTDETHQRGEELVEKCGNALKTALRDTSFELGFNGEKHELILSPEGLRSRLFPLVYFQKQAPESVLEHWNIWVGRQPCEGFELRAGEIEVRAEDVQMWAEETEDHQVSLVLYCEKLTPILKEDTDKVWWALSMLVDQTIGEVSAIAFVAGFDVYAQPKDEPAKLLSELPELLQSMGLSLWRDGSDYLENSYLAYELEPVEDPEADWRLDVYTGSCRLPVLINDYLTARSDMVDEYHKDGIAAGFLLYPLSGFTGEERVKAILDFRDNLRDAILRDAGEEAVTFLGGATGLYCGYLDFIAWDLPAVLTAAQAFFEGSDLPYAKRESVKEGFVPVLIKADDEILWECLIMNSAPDSDGEDDYAFDPDKVAEYRKKILSAPVENSKAVLEEMIGQRKEEAEDDDMDWDEEILGEMEGGYDNRRFSSYWNSDNNMTYPLILAKIPVKNPWEIFAYLPFGGWNECPNTPELMAVAKYWFEQHGAVPAAMSHDELEFLLPAPVPEEKAMDAAVELYGFCPDVIDQGPEDATVGALADVLRQSTVWYFWWD